MADASSVLQMIQEKGVRYVDLRFTDPRGKLQHLTMDIALMDAEAFADGVMFDGSSIAGWKAINESDMVLMPNPDTAHIDPFYGQTTLAIFCDILEPDSGERYERDPRGIAMKAEEYMKSLGLGDNVYFGPEAEFFLFDDVRFSNDMYNTGFTIDDVELPSNSGKEYDGGNKGHRPRVKGGYFPVNPIDSCQDIRSEMVSVMAEMGVSTEKHHHEVAAAQHELGIKYDTLTRVADQLQIYKYVVHNVAAAYGKTATFMPKPVAGDNGTGMHVHQSIFNGSTPVFAGDKYAGLSQECLWYIGGIIKHGKSLNAFTNPSTNSYKRLIPGFEAPVMLAYSAKNRSASCRIPHVPNAKGKRVEVRFPDPTANPYLAFSAMLMAGLDGIKNQIDPGPASDEDLYELSAEEQAKIPQVCGSLREAVEALKADHAYLLEGNVFTADQINAYLELLMEDVIRFEHAPHPVEFDMYFSC